MTPAARVAAAIYILDDVIAGKATEAALLNWARASRFAGSKDRAAVRDLVFDARRKWASCQLIGGGQSGRQIMMGLLYQTGEDLEALFSGTKYAAERLTESEKSRLREGPTLPSHVRADLQPWVWERISDQHAEAALPIADALRERAPVFVRVNTGKTTKDAATFKLQQDGIAAQPTSISQTALEITAGARKIRVSDAYQDGLIELQDAASQALVEALPLQAGTKVLDFCAGGGGKSLAMAARGANVSAFDIKTERMGDLPERATRAGAKIDILGALPGAPSEFDLVLCDAPCSGSGSWRRSPDGKWALTEPGLEQLQAIQLDVIQTAQEYVNQLGHLAYATCSILQEENEDIVEGFRRLNPEWVVSGMKRWRPTEGADGFFLAILKRA